MKNQLVSLKSNVSNGMVIIILSIIISLALSGCGATKAVKMNQAVMKEAYPEEMIAEMRRLSRGAKVVATALFDAGDSEIRLKVSELNGVAVTITSADIKLCKNNRFSKIISLFVWKVPSVIEHNSSISIDPVKICGNSANILLPTIVIRKSLTDYLLGANFELIANLNGYDEIGRLIRTKVAF